MNSRAKDVFAKVYKNCPQDENALYGIIMSVLNNENLYNLSDDEKEKLKLVHENILLDGDFGIGKTTMAEEVARSLDLPFYKFIIPKVGSGFPYQLLISNFNDVYRNIYVKNGNPKLRGVVVFEELEKILNADCLSYLDSVINMETFMIYDKELGENVVLDISNITYIGEVNRDRAADYIDVSIDPDSYKDVLADNEDFSLKDKEMLRNVLIHLDMDNQLNLKINHFENSPSMWHVFQKHINFKKLDVSSIKLILRDSEFSKYKALASMFDGEDYLKFLNDKLIDRLAKELESNPNRLCSIPDYFNEFLNKMMEYGFIDVFPENGSKQKKKEM